MRYTLLKKYETPSQTIYPGVTKDINDWKNIFTDLCNDDFDIKKDWFRKDEEEIDHTERYPLCEDQLTQLECRVSGCVHYSKGHCLNVSPAITLHSDGIFVCWTNKDLK